MSTNKPILQVVIDDETLSKFRKLCEREGRSASNLAKKLISDYVQSEENSERQPKGGKYV